MPRARVGVAKLCAMIGYALTSHTSSRVTRAVVRGRVACWRVGLNGGGLRGSWLLASVLIFRRLIKCAVAASD
jgi:hypothetical protein